MPQRHGEREKDANGEPRRRRRTKGGHELSLLKVVLERGGEREKGGGRYGQGGLPKTDMDCRLFWTSGCGLAKG